MPRLPYSLSGDCIGYGQSLHSFNVYLVISVDTAWPVFDYPPVVYPWQTLESHSASLAFVNSSYEMRECGIIFTLT